MKKGRPGTVVQVLCDPSMVTSLRSVLRRTTGSLGVRVTLAERWPAARSSESVWIEGQLIRLKVSAAGVKAEHDDVARAARRTGMPLREVAFRAEALWRSVEGGPRMAPSDNQRHPTPDLTGWLLMAICSRRAPGHTPPLLARRARRFRRATTRPDWPRRGHGVATGESRSRPPLSTGRGDQDGRNPVESGPEGGGSSFSPTDWRAHRPAELGRVTAIAIHQRFVRVDGADAS